MKITKRQLRRIIKEERAKLQEQSGMSRMTREHIGNMRHDFEKAIKEINRVSKKSYIVVESYRNEKELFNLQCWNTVGECFFDPDEWKYLFKKNNYKGDFEFIYFQ